ncbi:MAG: hypothetical protein EBU47_09985 [Betaproteobacteria bacterium]|nr:hypothetical protein [Betaproteobacteria bacterium]
MPFIPPAKGPATEESRGLAAEAHDHASGEHGPASKKRPRGVYWLPNLFTTASLFCGFTSIVQGMNHRFDLAAMLCFFALIFDSLDGRVARWTGTTSAFGEQYDSLSDMVSFGAAPALIMYEWPTKTAVHAQSRNISALTSPVKAPSSEAERSCAPSLMAKSGDLACLPDKTAATICK